jgi:aspartate/methionine/tyrosine aminotransferase
MVIMGLAKGVVGDIVEINHCGLDKKEDTGMDIRNFAVEEWMNKYETLAKNNIAETCVDSLTLRQLISLTGAGEDFLQDLLDMRLTYGHIEGSPELKEGIASLYADVTGENIVATNGAIGANFLTLYSIVEPGDEVVSVMPTYQQLYSIPASFGAEVKLLKLKPENKFLPDLEELKALVTQKTKIICINNPNNPTGALMDENLLKSIVKIAEGCNAFILCDEVYRGLYQKENVSIPSIVDLYSKGISTGSMSKVYSLAGLRLGWIVSSKEIVGEVLKHRDYNIISCGVIDDRIAALALKNKEKIMARNAKLTRENLEILDHWVRQERLISYVKPEAGTTAFLQYKVDMPSEEFCAGLLKETGTFVVPGKAFDMEGYFRVGYAFGRKDLEEGLRCLSRYLASIA